MKKRTVSLLLALTLLLGLLLGAALHVHAAEECAHDYTGASYGYDSEGHWQECTKCGTASDKVPHSYNDVESFVDQALPHRHRMKCVCQRTADAWEDCSDGNEDGLCDTCGNGVTCGHTYENSSYLYDESDGAAGHYRYCKVDGCNQPSAKEDHVDEDGNGECDFCFYRMPCEHDYTGADYHSDSEGHWQSCTKGCGASGDTEPHADTNGDGRCDTCHYVTCTHDNMTYNFDAEGHFLHCAVCDKTGEKTPHVYNVVGTMFLHQHRMKCGVCARQADEWGDCADSDGDSYCDTCGQCVGDHEFEGGYYHADEIYHSPKCDNCPYYDTGRKELHADTDADHFCDDCEYEMSSCTDEKDNDHFCDICGEELTHDHSTEWKSDATSHWHECSCGAKKDITAHNYGEWTVTKEATETEKGSKTKTCACGHAVTEEISALGSGTKNPDDTNNSNLHDVSNPTDENDGLSGGAVAGIVVGSVAVVGLGGFAIFWFVIKKKKWSDFIGIFKK